MHTLHIETSSKRASIILNAVDAKGNHLSSIATLQLQKRVGIKKSYTLDFGNEKHLMAGAVKPPLDSPAKMKKILSSLYHHFIWNQMDNGTKIHVHLDENGVYTRFVAKAPKNNT